MVKSSTGLDENTVGLLCYVLGWVSGVVLLSLEGESKFGDGKSKSMRPWNKIRAEALGAAEVL